MIMSQCVSSFSHDLDPARNANGVVCRKHVLSASVYAQTQTCLQMRFISRLFSPVNLSFITMQQQLDQQQIQSPVSTGLNPASSNILGDIPLHFRTIDSSPLKGQVGDLERGQQVGKRVYW